jgi:hypothetical protein
VVQAKSYIASSTRFQQPDYEALARIVKYGGPPADAVLQLWHEARPALGGRASPAQIPIPHRVPQQTNFGVTVRLEGDGRVVRPTGGIFVPLRIPACECEVVGWFARGCK